jgi:hypothetical protein
VTHAVNVIGSERVPGRGPCQMHDDVGARTVDRPERPTRLAACDPDDLLNAALADEASG